MILFHKNQFDDLLSGFDSDVVTFDREIYIRQTGSSVPRSEVVGGSKTTCLPTMIFTSCDLA